MEVKVHTDFDISTHTHSIQQLFKLKVDNWNHISEC